MPISSNTVLSMILVSLGFIAVILSFMVPDRKKSFISFVMALVIIVAGIFHLGSSANEGRRWQKKFRNITQDRKVDLEKLREEFKKKAEDAKRRVNDAKKK